MDNIRYKKGLHDRYDITLSDKCIGWARYNEKNNYIYMLWIAPNYRRQGFGSNLVRFIGNCVGKKLNRAPSHTKNDAVKALSVKMGEELGEEFRAVSTKRHN